MAARAPDSRSLAALLPDLPRWVEIRGMLLAGRARVLGWRPGAEPCFVVAEEGLAGVAGTPDGEAIREAAELVGARGVVVAMPESAGHVAAALPRWRGERAVVHRLMDRSRLPEVGDVGWLGMAEIVALSDLPEALREELTDAAGDGTPIMAAFAEGWPVSFCYAGSVTEALWDISIDTLEPYRPRGHAGRCVAALIAHYDALGKSPVWGSEVSNPASARLAAKLGFEVVDEVAVFKRGGEV